MWKYPGRPVSTSEGYHQHTLPTPLPKLLRPESTFSRKIDMDCVLKKDVKSLLFGTYAISNFLQRSVSVCGQLDWKVVPRSGGVRLVDIRLLKRVLLQVWGGKYRLDLITEVTPTDLIYVLRFEAKITLDCRVQCCCILPRSCFYCVLRFQIGKSFIYGLFGKSPSI